MRTRNLFMAATIMCALCTVAFTFTAAEINWIWAGRETAAVLLGIAALAFATQWLKHQKLVNRPGKN